MSVRVLSLDPGLTTLGWAYSTYDIDKNHFTVHKFGHFKATKSAAKEKDKCEIYGARLIALDLLEQTIINLIKTYRPNYVVSEDIFLHIRHINSYAALVLCLHALRRAAYTQGYVLYTLAPMLVKKVSAHTGIADKIAVQKAILSNKNITVVNSKQNPVSAMCEHEADAIAVGHAFCLYQLPSLLVPTVEVEPSPEIKRKKKLVKRDTTIVLPIPPSEPVEGTTIVIPENANTDIPEEKKSLILKKSRRKKL